MARNKNAYDWFEVEVINDFRGHKKGEIIYCKKSGWVDKGFQIFDNKVNVPFNQIITVKEDELKKNVKTIRDSKNRVKFVDSKLESELNKNVRICDMRLD